MKNALISVSDKSGVIEFAEGLAGLGYSLISSGGTAAALKAENVPVTEVAEYTGAPEILGGRVKTLHPKIYGGILARPTSEHLHELERHAIPTIDVVVCNLYPFEWTIQNTNATVADAIENIDIGGVTLLRAAAKNHERVLLLCDPADYAEALEKLRDGSVDDGFRRMMAIKGFATTARYDKAIFEYLQNLKG